MRTGSQRTGRFLGKCWSKTRYPRRFRSEQHTQHEKTAKGKATGEGFVAIARGCVGPAGMWVQVQRRPTGDAKGTGEVSLVSLAGS